jgi:large subunit ribosomal protein L18
MAKGPTYVVAFRRKREGKTDYRKRLNLLKSRTPRVVVRKSLKHITMQLVEYNPTGDKILVSVHTNELQKLGWKGNTSNTSAAYLTGLLLAKKAKEKNIQNAIADLGLYPTVKGSKLFAAVKGVVDGGLNVPFDDSIAPSEDRLQGKHISEDVAKQVEEIKKKIMGN